MNLYYVTGYYYADWALKYLQSQGMAHKENKKIVVDTQPIYWDQVFPFGEMFEPYIMNHWAKSEHDLQIPDLPWVELPTVEQADPEITNHRLMLKIGAPMLPGFC